MKRYKTSLKWVLAIALVIPAFIYVVQAETTGIALANQPNPEQTTSKKELSKEELISLTDQFMDKLVQETNENYKVKQYNTKKELLNDFQGIASKNAVKEYVDFYYQEREDGLYILPTSTPPWFQNKNAYHLQQLGENHVKIIQKNQSDLHGNYTLKLELKYDEQWKITSIKHS